jgi:hypothetical protein
MYFLPLLRKQIRKFLFPLQILLMAYFNFGRFDTEEEAIAIANATDVGLAGRCLSLFNNSQSFSQANVRLCLLNINLAFEKETSTECFVTFQVARVDLYNYMFFALSPIIHTRELSDQS